MVWSSIAQMFVSWLVGWLVGAEHFVFEKKKVMVSQISKIVILKLLFCGRCLCTNQHGIKPQKTWMFSNTSVRTSKLI
jgi:hypothetical protein